MADLNVFQLTNQELHKTEGSADKKSAKKPVKESVRRTGSKRRKIYDIAANKIRFESLSRFLEDDYDDTEITADYEPEDDVVLVIDPDMEEVPEDVEEAEAEAEELIGSHVCKCSICGANYVTDAEITEDMEMEDDECPVCGETGEQIVVGVITPAEELSDEDEGDVDDVEFEEEETEEETEDGEEVEETEEEEEDFGESVKRSRGRVRRESATSRAPKRSAKQDSGVSFDEATFNRMLTTFAKENYSNVKFVKISSGSVRGRRLTLEGVVTTTKGSKRPIKFVCENFKPASRMTIKFREIGPFTESVKNAGATFILECVSKGNVIVPKALKYNFKAKNAGVRESRDTYSVTGRVLSESYKRQNRQRRIKK